MIALSPADRFRRRSELNESLSTPVIASVAKQSRLQCGGTGLLRYARNDGLNFGRCLSIDVDVVPSACPAVSGRSAALAAAHAGARRGRGGRPLVDGIPAFGISYAGRWKAYLVASRRYVGVDLEVRDRPDLPGLAQRLGRAVAGADEVEVDFLTRWVLKEACLKALGLGLLASLRHVRLRARRMPEPGCDGTRSFTASVGRIGMVAMALDIGFGLLAIAYRDSDGPPCLQLRIAG